MTRRMLPVLILGLLALMLVACSAAPAAPADEAVDLSALPVDLQTSDVVALLDNPDVVIIDVREQYEYDEVHIPGVELIPLGTIPQRMSEIPKDKTVITVCRSGNRSKQATDLLRSQGFDNVHNMLGGMNAWQADGYPVAR